MRLSQVLILLSISLSLSAQFDHRSVFPDLEDDALFDALVSGYKTNSTLSLSDTRDTLYRRVHFYDDSVRCVYSGLARFLNPIDDPSQQLFDNGGNTDINLEHSYPRSKGSADGLAVSDMHHLFPTRVPVNSARASDPFQELNDNQTTAWFYKDLTLSSPPSSAIDNFAEDTSEGFEPREDFKGNVARAAFYFYTMYRDEADDADPDFFELQRETLCGWHEQDPVDSLEWVRNTIIASYQDDKENPFILDCRLARLYCSDISTSCRTVSVDNNPTENTWTIYPNVVRRGDRITINHPTSSSIARTQVVDELGQEVYSSASELSRFRADFVGRVYWVRLLSHDGQVSGWQRFVVVE